MKIFSAIFAVIVAISFTGNVCAGEPALASNTASAAELNIEKKAEKKAKKDKKKGMGYKKTGNKDAAHEAYPKMKEDPKAHPIIDRD